MIKDKFEEMAYKVYEPYKMFFGEGSAISKDIALALKRVEKEGFERGFTAGLEGVDAITLAYAMPLDWRNYGLADLCYEVLKKISSLKQGGK